MKDMATEMEAKLSSYRSYFEDCQHFGTNDKLREEPTNLNPEESHFGLDGTFRQLVIDWIG